MVLYRLWSLQDIRTSVKYRYAIYYNELVFLFVNQINNSF